MGKGTQIALAISFATCFWGCWTRPDVTTSGSKAREGESSPIVAPKHNSLPEYRLGFGDVIEIEFFGNSEFNKTVKVRPDGRISLVRLGDLDVTGMTPMQLDDVITEAYAEFVRDPDVTVIIQEFGGSQVYVLGEVKNPGGYRIQRDMTLLHAIASAGGQQKSAKMGSVMIIRRDEANGVRAIKVDLGKSFKTRRGLNVNKADPFVKPLDIVYVPKTFLASVSDFMTQVYAGILPPLDLYLRALILDRNL